MWLGHSAFLEVPFLTFFAYTQRERGVARWDLPMLFTSQVVSACQNFKPVAPFFFLAKVQFLAFLNTVEGMAI